ncbi:MAG: patatin-like phospholipase family protein [Minisyncoccia bacterium]
MLYSGDLKVLTRLVLDTDRQSRRAMYAGPGGMRGVFAGAVTSELESLKLIQRFHFAFGGSTGALAVAYPFAGQAARGTDIYPNECLGGQFISYRRARTGRLMDLDYIASVFDTSPRVAIDHAALMRSKTECYFTLTNAETGEGEFFPIRGSRERLMRAVRATIAVPMFSDAIELEGKYYYDGGVGFPFPVREIIEQFHPTDLLIIANRTPEYRENGGILRRTWEHFANRNLPEAVRLANARRGEVFEEGLAYLKHQTACRWLILWGDPRLGAVTQDREKILRVIADTRRETVDLIRGLNPKSLAL